VPSGSAAFNSLEKLYLLFARPDNTIDEVIVPVAELALLPMSPVPVAAALPLFASNRNIQPEFWKGRREAAFLERAPSASGSGR
jgi:hypothetical protein